MNAPVDSDKEVAESPRGARAEGIDPARLDPCDSARRSAIARHQPLGTVQVPSRRQGIEDIGDEGSPQTTPQPTLVVRDWDYRALVAPAHVSEVARRVTGAEMGALVVSVESGGFVLEKVSGRQAIRHQWSVIPGDRWSVNATSSWTKPGWYSLDHPLPGIHHAIVAIVPSLEPWTSVGLLVANHEPARTFNRDDGLALAALAAHPSVRAGVAAWLTSRSS
jgi:hypothetical protein